MEKLFGDEPTRGAPMKGRRAFQETSSKQSLEDVKEPAEAAPPVASKIQQDNVSSEDFELPKRKKPGRRRQMWNSEGNDVVEDQRFNVGIGDGDVSDSEEIPTIPDLEQLNDEPLADQIAAPPSAIFNDLLSYNELDKDLMRQSAFQMLDNEIDLKILTKALIPERDTMETDETWEMEKLFAEMQSTVTCCNKNIIGQEEILKKEREVLI